MIQRLFTMEIRLENDVVMARQKARTVASALRFDPQDQIRIATAVSEIARNTFQYGGGGRAEFQICSGPEKMLVVTLRDQGKGIANLDEILDGKYVSETGMGLGVIGAKRLMDYFHIESKPGKGTTVQLGKLLPRRHANVDPSELPKIVAKVERSSDDPYQELRQQNTELLNTLQELRARQDELAQLNRELDETNRGVVALYAELNEKADFLQRASELKSRFLSNMSHEFRTPLNSIIGLARILLDRLDGNLTEEQEKQVRFISNAAEGLAELVNDLLDLAKVEAGRVTVRPVQFDVPTLFATLRGMLRPLLSPTSSVNLTFEIPEGLPTLYTDEAKLAQIMRNFISNALKFTESGEIRVSARNGSDGQVVFSVADTGIGIAPADQDRIFQEWTQVDDKQDRAVKGSGLGLPLSRKFAQLLGGDVSVESTLGIGSTFFAAIPIHFSGQTEVVADFMGKRVLDPDKAQVLIIEDNRETLFIYDRYFRNTHYQPLPVTTIREARQAIRDFRPTAIVLDLLLQGEQSWDLLHELKQSPMTREIPVFVVTVVDNRDKALAMGADAFHEKPIDRTWLLDHLDQVSQPVTTKLILLIDDDEASRYLVRASLGRLPVQIVESATAREGMKKIFAAKPDAIILDLGLPDIPGTELLAYLKQDARTADIPIVIHTSKLLDAEEERALAAAVAIVPKNFQTRERLQESFTEALRKAGFTLPAAMVTGAGHD